MNGRRIISLLVIFYTIAAATLRRDVAWAQVPVEYAPAEYGSTGPYMMAPMQEDCSQPKPVFIEPQPQVWLQPLSPRETTPVEMVPIMPLPESAGPRPGEMMSPMFGAPLMEGLPQTGAQGGVGVLPPPPAEAGSPAGGPLENIAPGGAVSPQFGLPRGPEVVSAGAPPIFVPAANDEYTWEQIADVVSDYFTIGREQQVRRSGEAWCEGRIETQYQGGATWLEPFRKDSVGAFNKWESTFQTIRRRAIVRVIPDANGFMVEVIVEKELEDLPHPERASASVASFPNDFSLPTQRAGDVSRTMASPRWLPMGRDPALEAKMLAEIHARLNGVTTASSPSIWQ
jgi:hypothetical protein